MKKVATFDWEKWIPKIEEVARKNDILEIDLPEEEWRRLKKEDLASLKKQLSNNAAARLTLLHQNDRYYLLIFRYGRCPRCLG